MKVFLFMSNYRRELRIGADIRKKRKSRKSNRVCRENEKGARESRSNVEEGTGGYEKTSR